MPDVVVTVPKQFWQDWLDEGDLPGDPESGLESFFTIGNRIPDIKPGERVYIVAHGRLRGFAPLVRIDWEAMDMPSLCRKGGAVACTIRQPIPGFRGWRYRWWDRDREVPFPGFRETFVGDRRQLLLLPEAA